MFPALRRVVGSIVRNRNNVSARTAGLIGRRFSSQETEERYTKILLSRNFVELNKFLHEVKDDSLLRFVHISNLVGEHLTSHPQDIINIDPTLHHTIFTFLDKSVRKTLFGTISSNLESLPRNVVLQYVSIIHQM